jgi:hypothetical protein
MTLDCAELYSGDVRILLEPTSPKITMMLMGPFVAVPDSIPQSVWPYVAAGFFLIFLTWLIRDAVASGIAEGIRNAQDDISAAVAEGIRDVQDDIRAAVTEDLSRELVKRERVFPG